MSSLVTVIIPSYNHSKFIQETIKSVIRQKYEQIELIIIDDGSKDNSVQKIEEMRSRCEERFTNFEFRHRSNKGLCATLNEALSCASGEYISIIASDDFMYQDKTSIQVQYLNLNKDCIGVFSGAKIIKENGESITSRPGSQKKYFFKDIILNNYQLFSPSAMYRASEINAVGGYNESVLLEDWFMNLKVTEHAGYLYATKEILIAYRRHENNASNNSQKLHTDRQNILQLFSSSKYYQDAKGALLYTIGYESITFNKKITICNFLKTLTINPLILLRKQTVITLIKLFIPKKILLNRTRGR